MSDYSGAKLVIEQFFDVVRKNNLTDVLSVPFLPLRPSALHCTGCTKPTVECPSRLGHCGRMRCRRHCRTHAYL
jgi:hypothetical protein